MNDLLLQSTIQDLFNIDQSEESAANRMSEVLDRDRERRASLEPSAGGDEKAAIGALESALAAAEDDQDVQAARTAKAEAVADLAEFDENIPLDDQEREPEMSKAEQEIDNVIKKVRAMDGLVSAPLIGRPLVHNGTTFAAVPDNCGGQHVCRFRCCRLSRTLLHSYTYFYTMLLAPMSRGVGFGSIFFLF